MLKKYIALIILAFLSSCAVQQGHIHQDTTAVYNRAIDDAAVAGVLPGFRQK